MRHQAGPSMLEGNSLLFQGGFIRILGKGLISFLPMGTKVINNLKILIAQEMHFIGGEEFQVPLVNPFSIWEKSGRSNLVDGSLVVFKDSKGRKLVLSPTHEEAAVELAKSVVNSYKDFPIFFYQFQTKFRDESRTRAELIRAREFVMKDAYSFHRSYSELNNFFPKVFNSYMNIFKRCNIPVIPAESGVGMMGGSKAYEFLYPHDQGRDVVLVCPHCGYRANRSVAIGVKPSHSEILYGMERVSVSEKRNLEKQAAELNISPGKIVKPRVYMTADGPVMAVVRGDYDVSLDKLAMILGCAVSKPANDSILRDFKLIPGFMSPVPAPDGVRVIVDDLVVSTPNLAMGLNEDGFYYVNVNFGRDFDLPETGDIAQLNEGDLCMGCGKALDSVKAFELGNIFKLDDYYTRKMNFSFNDDKGKQYYPFMGSYGLGLGRLVSCIAEANRDNKGLVWPIELAPYTFYLMGIGKSSRISSVVDEIARELGEENVLLDDRKESIGVKFRDSDLLGIPLRMVVSRHFIEKGEIDMRDRRSGRKWYIKRENLKKEIKKWRDDQSL